MKAEESNAARAVPPDARKKSKRRAINPLDDSFSCGGRTTQSGCVVEYVAGPVRKDRDRCDQQPDFRAR